jgi:hypothetical protein
MVYAGELEGAPTTQVGRSRRAGLERGIFVFSPPDLLTGATWRLRTLPDGV